LSEATHRPVGTSTLSTLPDVESWSAEEILTWAIKKYHPRLALSCSFGNPEGLVLLDMMHRIEPTSRVYVLDTGRLHQETYDLIDRVRDRYDKTIEVVFPDAAAVEAMVRSHGMNLFYESLEKRQLCCGLRKVEPSRRYLAGLDAYVTGLRRSQNVTRADARKLELDENLGGIVKVNPLVDWSADRVWGYVREHHVPVNRLHAEGTKAMRAPDTRDALGKQGFEVVANSPAEFSAWIRTEQAKWSKVIRASGATAD